MNPTQQKVIALLACTASAFKNVSGVMDAHCCPLALTKRLEGYRYAGAKRATVAGYPERLAQQALGHNSKAVHRAYSRKAVVKVPSLEDYEARQRQKSVVMIGPFT